MRLKVRNGIWYVVGKIKRRRYRLSTGFPVRDKQTKTAALRRAAELELEIRSGRYGWKPTVPTVKVYWTKTYRPTYTIQKRAPQRDDQVMMHFLPALGDRPLDQIRKSDCEGYLNRRRKATSANPRRKTPGTIAEGTVQRERSFLHAFFQQAVEDELIDKNPWRGVERKDYAVRDRVLTAAEQAELLRRLSPRFQRFVLFCLGTGCRLDEVRGIDHEKDLHLEERFVRVTGKFGKTRDIPLPAELVPTIEEQLQADGKLWTQNPQRLREVLAEACRARRGRPALAHVSPHVLRHTFGHRWLVGGGDIYTLSKILGHASVAVTEKHYAHLLRENIQAKADRVDLGLGLPKEGKLVVGAF